ncbi:uncharacterized protein LOC111291419 isoform X2 [Durio zibethinus]|uniref:Uncharacterized protein LOC111291419 isoform X2 n=1 Tax=Durio zibethinus TaxID=66656 RepID=A0A6P5YEC6_DURZI|nr:uncharacterized protein LOC111291419 isoform X2 [Durio zibethinus]
MRSEKEDQCLVPQSEPDEPTRCFRKKPKFSYKRDFLFSLAELDTCKKLPTGFDSSILRELDDQSETVRYSYHDSDACRLQSSLSHCEWRNPEQGLLASGAFARVHRGVAETSVPVVQGGSFQLLNRSSEPYRPPHLCKAKYYSGRESKDLYNDETFGSPDNMSQDRAEKEKFRRDSFELMRKEQEMATQEKKKKICDEQKENLNPEIAIVLEDSGVDKKVANKYSESKASETCDVKEGHPENPSLFSSYLTHQLLEGEKKTAGDQNVIEYDSIKFSFETNGFGHKLIKSALTPVTKEVSVELHGRCNPGVLSFECLEESILSEIKGHDSTQHHSINGRNSYDVVESQPSYSYYDVAHQHFLSLLLKGAGLTDLAESSMLNTWSLDKPYVSETEIDNNQLKKTGTRKDLTSRSKQDYTMESHILLPVGDNSSIPLTVNESGSIGDVDGIAFSSFVKQTGVSKRNINLLVSDIQAKAGLDLKGRPESLQSSLTSFDELDICLPDEDSLITVDDYIFPQDSMFVAAGGTLSAPINTFKRLFDCRVAVSNKRSDLAGFGSSTSFRGSHNLLSLETCYNCLHKQQSYPQLYHSQMKPAKARMSHSKCQESQRGSRIKPRDLKSYPYNLQSLQYFPKNVHLTPRHLRAAATGFNHSGTQLLQELPVPGYFPHHQLYEQPRVAFPQHTSDEMACYGQDQNAMLKSLDFNQQSYNYPENDSSRNFEMGIERKADASSPTTAGHVQEVFGRKV